MHITNANIDGKTTTSSGKVATKWYAGNRLGGLRRFAFAITFLNILGHTWFGFEQSWAQPLVAMAAAYAMELILELVECAKTHRKPRFTQGPMSLVDFFLPAQISGMACSMLLYANERLVVIAFAAAMAIASKHIFRVAVGRGVRHIFNPSNLGITITLLLFPWVGIAQPYQFTENLDGIADWILPAIIVVSGTFLNWRFTKRLPLIAAWLTAFVLQAYLRHLILGSAFSAALLPMTGMAFILYSFYMVTDPPTTPASIKGQIFFGFAVAATYGILMVLHVVFGLFFALTIVSSLRGIYLYSQSLKTKEQSPSIPERKTREAPVTETPMEPILEPVATARDYSSTASLSLVGEKYSWHIAFCAAFVFQGLGLMWWTGASGAAATYTMLALILACLVVATLRRWIKETLVVKVLLSTAAFGGLGMLAGGIVDGFSQNSGYCCCLSGDLFSESGQTAMLNALANWSTLGMFAFCIPACLWICGNDQSSCHAAKGWIYHLGTNSTMLFGMLWGGWFLAVLFGDINSTIAVHWAMVGGMTLGTLFGHLALNSNGGLGRFRNFR